MVESVEASFRSWKLELDHRAAKQARLVLQHVQESEETVKHVVDALAEVDEV